MNPLCSILLVSIAALAPVFSFDGIHAILTSTSAGLALGMNLYLLPGYDPRNPNKRYPQVGFLGDASERGDATNGDVARQKSTAWKLERRIRYSDCEFSFMVVTPIRTMWYFFLPIEYGIMVESLKSTRRIDPDRVYFPDACAGASSVVECTKVYHQMLEAIAPALIQTPTSWHHARLQEMSIWLFHSFADPFVSRQQTITWADAIANSMTYHPQSCMDTYSYGITPSGDQTYNPNIKTGSFRPCHDCKWTHYTRSADGALLLFTMMSTEANNVWHYAVTNLPRSGTYSNLVWYPATPSHGKSPVTTTNNDSDMSAVITIDQQANGATWNMLGIPSWNAGSGPAITIGRYDSGGCIDADAVRLVESPIGGPE